MELTQKEIRVYETVLGRRPYDEWFDDLDRSIQARVSSRLARVRAGNLGDATPVGQGVSEIRFHFGSGYRVYFAQEGDKVILLLCAGDKSSQDKDIQKAKEYLDDFWRRENE